MLRITKVDSSLSAAVLRLEGRLVGPWVEEFRRSCEQVLAGGRRLVLDLKGLSFIDGGGIEALRQLKTAPVSLTNCSPFVAGQLKEIFPC